MSLAKLRSRVPEEKLPENILKLTLIHILIALEFLHTHANIIHCGKPHFELYRISLKLRRPSREKCSPWYRGQIYPG
jgi:hypothetical protein